LVALFFGGLGLWAGAVVWLFLAHRRMAHVTSGREVRRDGLTVDSALWGRLGVAATALLTVATAVVFVLGIRPDPSYASAYDGQDPNAANCVDTAVTTIVGQDGPVVSDLTGRKVGHVELRASPKCGTIWAKVLFEPTIAPSLNGELIMLVMYRPPTMASGSATHSGRRAARVARPRSPSCARCRSVVRVSFVMLFGMARSG
jgi:hypothetical protein